MLYYANNLQVLVRLLYSILVRYRDGILSPLLYTYDGKSGIREVVDPSLHSALGKYSTSIEKNDYL